MVGAFAKIRAEALEEFQVSCPKVREVPLESKLHHLDGPINIGLEWLTLGHFVGKVVDVCLDEGPRGNIVE